MSGADATAAGTGDPHRSEVVVEADGGSRGNPGPAGYGAVLRDAGTGQVIAEAAEAIGIASNNVAEYRGLIAGLELAAEFAPDAAVEVRMDSELVVKQMTGVYKVRHPDLKPLKAQAERLAPAGTGYTWVPREQNAHGDRLANEAMDGTRSGVTVADRAAGRPAAEQQDSDVVEPEPGEEAEREDSVIEEVQSPPAPGDVQVTTLILVRHGVTEHTSQKRFSGGLGGANPRLSAEGRGQVRTTARWLAPLAERVDLVVASPVRRTRETAEIIADVLDRPLEEEPDIAEMEFGHWDGMTFAEVGEEHPEELEKWLGSLDVAPAGGESFRDLEARVLAGRDRLLAEHTGRTVVVVSHVTPIKTIVAHALGAPLEALYRMELAPAAVSVVAYYTGPDGEPRPSLRMYNAQPSEAGALGTPTHW